MAIIYNFLDYKDPKRKVRKFLITGWILAVLSLVTFMSLSYSLVLGSLAIIMGAISNDRIKNTGTKLIISSMLLVMVSLIVNYFLSSFIKLIMNVFFIIG